MRLHSGGGAALIESFFWDPPGMGHFWFSLWDLETGLLLMDRAHIETDILSDNPIELADLDPSGRFLLFLTRPARDELVPVSWLQIRPPEDAALFIPELAEAIGGSAYDRAGNSAPLPDRINRLERLLAELARFGGGGPSAGTRRPTP